MYPMTLSPDSTQRWASTTVQGDNPVLMEIYGNWTAQLRRSFSKNVY